MLCLATDTSISVIMFHSAIYITVRSGLGAVKNGKGDDPLATNNDN